MADKTRINEPIDIEVHQALGTLVRHLRSRYDWNIPQRLVLNRVLQHALHHADEINFDSFANLEKELRQGG